MKNTLTILPFSGGGVDNAKQFIVGDSLGIKIHGGRGSTIHEVRVVKSPPDFSFACACGSINEDRVTHGKQFVQLYNLKKRTQLLINLTNL